MLIDSNINSHSFAFSFDTRGAKEKALQKEKRRFSGALPLLTPPPFEKGGRKLSLIALCEMYIVPDGFDFAPLRMTAKIHSLHYVLAVKF